MRRVGPLRKTHQNPSTSLLATSIPTTKINFHIDATPPQSEDRYVGNAKGCATERLPKPIFDKPPDTAPDDQSLPCFDTSTIFEDAPGAVPAYKITAACDEKGESKRRQVSRHPPPHPCACGIENRLRKVACHEFLQAELNTVVALGHHGQRCPDADLGHSFTLVESNGIHATAISFCRCKRSNGERGNPEFQQLLRAGIFPGSVKEPKTGYTLNLLEFYRQLRNQGKGSAYSFVHVLQRMADPFFAGSVPDLDIVMRCGYAHDIEEALPGEADRPYPNRPPGYLGLQCEACPERGVNMPFVVNVPNYLRHLISQHFTLDGNFKANLFFKRDDGSDTCLTDGKMYFPKQTEFEELAKVFVVTEADKEVPCKAHIGSIRHQGQVKYGNTAVSGVVGCACDHAVVGSFVNMPKGEAFPLGTYAQHEQLKHMNSPPHGPASTTPTVFSYDSYCSFVVNMVKRAIDLFPEETWLHAALAAVEGQIPADHITGHGTDCQAVWQAVYFACRSHFHGETAEMIWVFLNGLGSSTRQMTGAARHDIMNFVVDAWNTWKVLRQVELLAAERLDALRLFELHMAVVEDLSWQHATKVAGWSRLLRITTKSADGTPRSVYQHESTKVLTIDNALASMITEERSRLTREDEQQARTSVAEWIHDGISLERQEVLIIALLESHREHPMQETWATITKLRDTLNLDLKKFWERQPTIYPRLRLSALDIDEPELTAVQLPSYHIKHGQRVAMDAEDSKLREAEIKLRCGQANSSGDYAFAAEHTESGADEGVRDNDVQPGASRAYTFGPHGKDAVEPYPPLSYRDTRRKETHLHRAKGDSRLFDGTAWYLQSGVTISRVAVTSTVSPVDGSHDSDDDEPQLLAGTQTLKRSGFTKSQRTPKRLKDIAADDVVVESVSASEAEDSDLEMSPSAKRGKQAQRGKKGKKKSKKSDGWIWLESMTRGQTLGEAKLAAYKEESDRVQWFRAEAEMYRWLEQYERKHAEMMRVIERFRRDNVVWEGLADRVEEQNGGRNGAVNFARMQAAMYKRLQHNATVTFKSAESGAHRDWVWATTFDELVTKIDGWRNVVFKWMDEMVGGTASWMCCVLTKAGDTQGVQRFLDNFLHIDAT
ncbi:hypothetical protein B0H10DRAFT_1937760 [Mycena sp. CBHHK59/15]|nr:hypothetical protein B0H10DRAFT_1937760 [Mycena sp. CBHHK59/15]